MNQTFNDVGIVIDGVLYPHQHLLAPVYYSDEMWAVFTTFARSHMLPMTAVLRKLREGDLNLLESLQNVFFPIA